MSEYLTFDPNTEFKLIGDAFEMDEHVQRSSSIRFYTLDEQIADAFEKMIHTVKETKFEIEKLTRRVDRIRELYTAYVVPTADGYVVHPPDIHRVFPWVLPVYASSDLVPSNLFSTLGPLVSKESRLTANGFERILTAFPHPYTVVGEGFPYTLTGSTEFVDVHGKDPIRALPDLEMTQARQHENGTVVVSTRVIEGTSDTVKCIGYYLTERIDPIPNPIADHPFFADKSARFYNSTRPIDEIVPDVKTVLEHGVPVTTDPYGEGMKFLRVYDVHLSDIRWSSWSSRFPSVERVDGPPPREPLANVKKEAEYKPDQKLLTEYGTDYSPGLAARFWLMNQVDGGALVITMLKSNASSAGVMHLDRVVEPVQSLPQVPVAQCGLGGLSFHDFLIQGTTRQFDVTRDGKWIGNEYKCIPLDIVNQERKQVGHRNRIQWKDTTQNEMLTRYKQALLQYTRPPPTVKSFTGSKIPVRPDSQTRIKAVAILADPSRLNVDKKLSVEKLLGLSKALHSKQIWTDPDGEFVICDHTLAVLKGDLEKDSDQFYRTWTTSIEGTRTCKVCGEVISSTIFVDQAGYTDAGRVIVHSDILNAQVFSGHKIETFITSLRSLTPLFDMKDPADSTLFLLLSLLQVLPEQSQLLPILDFGRKASAVIGKKGSGDGVLSARGVIGIAGAIILLQSHVPHLVPRRSFGSRPLVLSGYPRDTDTATEFPIAESMFTVFRKTFQAYPTALQGSSVQVMRGILNSSKEIKSNLNVFIKQFAIKFKDQLTASRLELEKVPPVPEAVRLLTMILPPPPGDPIRFPQCPSTRLSWISTVEPVLRHAQFPLKKIEVSTSAIQPKHVAFGVQPTVSLSDAEIRALLALKPSKKMMITSSWKTNLILLQRIGAAIRRSDLIPLLDTTIPSEARLENLMDGFLRRMYVEIEKSEVLMRKYDELIQSDVTFFSVTKKIDEAKKDANKLRAQERHKFTDILRNQTDQDRQITKELIDLGLAPYLITNVDRDRFAQQLEDELRPEANEVNENEADTGVGRPQTGDGEEEDAYDDGNYGTNAAAGNREADTQLPRADEDDSI